MTVWTDPKTWAVGETLTAANLNKYLRDNMLYLMGGSDVASATSVTLDEQYHGITGTTTIDTITSTNPLKTGMVRYLLIKGGPLTIRNNGGGTGNVRTVTGADLLLPTNSVAMVIYDGTVWRIVAFTGVSYTSTVPASPSDSQEIYYIADAANAIIWHLRYNAGSSLSYKWEFLGGGALRSYVITQENVTGGSGYMDVATVGPSVTLPRAGIYQLEFGATVGYGSGRSGGSGSDIYVNVAVNANGTVINPQPQANAQLYTGGGTMGTSGCAVGEVEFTATTASQVVKVQYSATANFGTGGFTAPVSYRYLRVRPLAIS